MNARQIPHSVCSSWRPRSSTGTARAISRRTLFGFGGKKSTESDPSTDNPVYAEFLKKKPPPPPTLVRGDLASGSILESGDADPGAKKGEASRVRDPNVMAAVLDPQPDATKRWQRKMLIRDLHRRGRLSRMERIKKTEREMVLKSPLFATSIKKLGPLARQIAGKPVEDAIVQMRFSKKMAATVVKDHLEHARNEAIVRRGMALGEVTGTKGEPVNIETKDGKRMRVTDRTGLYVDQAWVGRGTYGAEPEFRARGRMNLLRPPQSSITVLLKEEATRIRQYEDRERRRRNQKVWLPLPNRPITAQAPYYSW